MSAGMTAQPKLSLGANDWRQALPIICFVVAMIDGYDTLMVSFLAPLISREWTLNPRAVGNLFAGTYAGAALGAVLIGVAADRFGRKPMLLVSLLLAGICTCAAAGSAGPESLTVWRAAAGIGLGGAIPTIAALTAAQAAPGRGSVAVARMFLGYPLGAMLGGIATAAIMSWLGWRGVMVMGGCIALLLIAPIAFFVRESGVGTTPARAAIHSAHPIVELVSEGRVWGTVLVCAATCLTLLVSYFLVSWTPTVLTLNGATPQRAAFLGAVLNLGGLGGACIMSSLVGRFRPSWVIACSLATGALAIGLLGQSVAAPTAVIFSLVFVVGLLIIGAQANIPALCVHYYPASVYATGVGVAMAVGRLGSIVGPLVGGRLMTARISWDVLFMVAAAPALVAAAALAGMPIRRTAGSRTLSPGRQSNS
jgi:MFS transporter, AAHS family, 4-hydroxybenzoate transporter